MKNTTFIIKTFERPEALRTLIRSIRKFYPTVKILIADDSRKPIPVEGKNIEYFVLPFDSGLSYGRNFLVDLVETKYTLLLDDDFIFTKDTKIEKFVKVLETTKIDIISGNVELDEALVNYHGLLELKGKTLHYKHGNRGEINGIEIMDLVLNFFLARTETLKDNPWDNDLKVAEHTDWMLRTKDLKKGFSPEVVVVNTKSDYSPGMKRYRQRGREFTYMWMKKHGIEKIVDFKGMEFTTPIKRDSAWSEIQQAALENERRRQERIASNNKRNMQ